MEEAEKNSSVQKNNLKERNPFLEARMACIQKNKIPSSIIKSKNEQINIDYGFEDNIITLRRVKSNEKLQNCDEIEKCR